MPRGEALGLACFLMIIPYLRPQLPHVQRAALAQNVKTPLVYIAEGQLKADTALQTDCRIATVGSEKQQAGHADPIGVGT
jgi:hypothetical protein